MFLALIALVLAFLVYLVQGHAASILYAVPFAFLVSAGVCWFDGPARGRKDRILHAKTSVRSANIIASFILLATGGVAIFFIPAVLQDKLCFGFMLAAVVPVCWYFWQQEQYGNEPVGWWVATIGFGIVWSFVDPLIDSLIDRVSYLKLLKTGYFGIGPLVIVVGVVGVVRVWILNMIEARSFGKVPDPTSNPTARDDSSSHQD